MKIYIVENGNWILDYFQHEENAIKERDRANLLNEEYKDREDVDTNPYYITEIETSD